LDVYVCVVSFFVFHHSFSQQIKNTPRPEG
jgi:hypothetical protein